MSKETKKVWSWRQAFLESDLSATTKLVLAVLSTHMNDFGGGCYPSLDRVAGLCSLSERSVRMQIDAGIKAGWLVKSKRNLRGSKWASNEYVAAFPADRELKKSVEDEGNYVPPTTTDGVDEGNHIPPMGGNTFPPEGNYVPPGGELGSAGEGNDVPTNSPVLTLHRTNSDNSNELSAAKAAKKGKQDLVVDPSELKRRLWATGKKYLTSSAFEGGKKITEERAGQIIGRWRKELKKALGEEAADVALLNALAKAEAEAAADPIAFIEACIAAKLTKGKPNRKADMPPEEAARACWRIVQSKNGTDDPWNRKALDAIRRAERQLGQLPPDLIQARQQCRKYLGMAA